MKGLKKISFITLLFCVSVAANSARGENASFAAPTSSAFAFTDDLALGKQGGEVSALQQFLIAGGYLKISTSTGYFGQLTKIALATWQSAVDISPAIGYFGPISRKKINVGEQSTPINVTETQNAITTTAAPVETTSSPAIIGEIGLPARLVIPILNIDAGFQDTGLKPDGTMEVPSTIYVVGWFTGSVRPGEKGVAIVTGHVAQIRGGVVAKMGVFSNLYEIHAGDTLQIADDKGRLIDFVVRAVRSYDSMADATDVFTSQDGGAHLNLITCEGTWNAAQLSYTRRLVVFTDLAQ